MIPFFSFTWQAVSDLSRYFFRKTSHHTPQNMLWHRPLKISDGQENIWCWMTSIFTDKDTGRKNTVKEKKRIFQECTKSNFTLVRAIRSRGIRKWVKLCWIWSPLYAKQKKTLKRCKLWVSHSRHRPSESLLMTSILSYMQKNLSFLNAPWGAFYNEILTVPQNDSLE